MDHQLIKKLSLMPKGLPMKFTGQFSTSGFAWMEGTLISVDLNTENLTFVNTQSEREQTISLSILRDFEYWCGTDRYSLNVDQPLFDMTPIGSGAVDLVTGLLKEPIQIASLSANNGNGPFFDFEIFHAPNSKASYQKWCPKLDHCELNYKEASESASGAQSQRKRISGNISPLTIYLTDGTTHYTNTTPGTFFLTPTIKATITAGSDSLIKSVTIIRQDGSSEILEKVEFTESQDELYDYGPEVFTRYLVSSYFLPTKIMSALGYALDIKWTSLPGKKPFPIIQSVSDSHGELLNSSWPTDSSTKTTEQPKSITFKSLTGTNFEQTTLLEFSNGNLSKSTTSNQALSSNCQYTYDTGSKLTSIKISSGITKTIKYNTDNQVSEYTLTSTPSGKYTETYTYENLKDGLKTVCTQKAEDKSVGTSEYIFDNTGRLSTVTKSNGDCSEITNVTQTYDKASKTLKQKIIKTWKTKDNETQDVITATFDVLGNLTSKTENGVTTEWTYYRGAAKEEEVVERTYRKTSLSSPTSILIGIPLDYLNPIGLINQIFNTQGLTWGTVNDIAIVRKPFSTSSRKVDYNLPIDIACPGDPNFFGIYVESEKTYTQIDNTRIDLQWIYYGYSSIPVNSSSVCGPAIKPSVKLTIINPVSDDAIKLKSWAGTMTVETTEYYTDVKDNTYGRVKKLSQRILDNKGNDLPLSVQTLTLEYNTLTKGLFTTNTTTVSPANTTTFSTTTLEVNTGLIMEMRDTDDTHTLNTYDAAGRLSTQVLTHKGSDATEMSFEYTTEGGQNCTITHLPSGGAYRDQFDCFGRTIIQDIQLSGQDKWLTLSTTTYDAIGRETKTTVSDYRYDGSKLFSKEMLTSYDNWGNVSRQQIVNGEASCFQQDPFARTLHEWNEYGNNVGEKIKSQYDDKGRVKTRSFVDLKGLESEVVTYAYDEFGRLSTENSATGLSTNYTYDAFDRITSIQQGDITTTNEYPAHTKLLVAVRATVKGPKDATAYELGNRKVDGLGRVIESVIGGCKQTYTYSGNSSWGMSQIKPARTVNPSATVTTTTVFNPAAGTTQQNTTSLLRKKTSTSASWSIRGLLLDSTDDFNNKTTFGYDALGRLSSTTNSKVSSVISYDGWGRLSKEAVTDTSTKQCMTTFYSYDSKGREIERRFESANFPTLTLTQTYKQGRLASSQLVQDKTELRLEKFTYTTLGQLESYECTGSHKPVDPANKSIDKQSFTYDTLGNITTCISVSGSSKDTALYNYSAINKMQLTSISHSEKSYTAQACSYDELGRMTETEKYKLAYNDSGNASEIEYKSGDYSTYNYIYDSFGRLAACNGGPYFERFYYRNDQQYARSGSFSLEGQIYNRTLVLLNSNHGCKLQEQTIPPLDGASSGASYSFELQDVHGSLVVSCDLGNKSMTFFAYTPFGYRPDSREKRNWLGYNGEPIDRMTGVYHLGNGYRAYDPVIQRFQSPDSLSPFGDGGANSYSYCADPINFSDPSGHIDIARHYTRIDQPYLNNPIVSAVFEGAIGIALAPFTGGASSAWTAGAVGIAVVSAGFGIAAAAIAQSNPQLSAGLGWASLGTGLASAGVGMFGAAVGSYKAATMSSRLARSGWGAERAVAQKMIERRGQVPVGTGKFFDVSGTVGGQAYSEAAEIYSGGLDSRLLFIDAHGLPRKGFTIPPQASTEIQFRSGLGTTATDYKTSWAERINSRTPYRYAAGDTKIPDYVIEEFLIADHIKAGSLSANFRAELATIAAGTGADILRPLGPMRFSDLLHTLEVEGFHYDRVVANFCRGTIRGNSWGVIKHVRRGLKLF